VFAFSAENKAFHESATPNRKVSFLWVGKFLPIRREQILPCQAEQSCCSRFPAIVLATIFITIRRMIPLMNSSWELQADELLIARIPSCWLPSNSAASSTNVAVSAG
jgi:hypothetical protein